MISHLLVVIISISVFEIVHFSHFFKKLQICIAIIKKITKIILSKKKSDHWKEKSLLKYSQQLLFVSFKLLGILFIILSVYFVITYFYEPFSDYFLSVLGIIETTGIILVYVYVKKLIYAKL